MRRERSQGAWRCGGGDSPAHAQIGKARYALEGASRYPDATGTLRLTYGVVKGYKQDGQAVPFQTTFAGLYERARQQSFRPPLICRLAGWPRKKVEPPPLL